MWKWPPEKAFEYDAEKPENGIVISAQPGGKPKNRRAKESKESKEGR